MIKTSKSELIVGIYRSMAERIINFPADLKVISTELPNSITLTIQSHTADHGKLIGEGGATFRALETVMKCCGNKHGKNIHMTQLQPEVGSNQPEPPFRADEQWNKDKQQVITDLINSVVKEICKYSYDLYFTESGYKTIYSLVLNPFEQTAVYIEKLNTDLEIIFHAIGKAQGRRIYIDTNKPTLETKE